MEPRARSQGKRERCAEECERGTEGSTPGDFNGAPRRVATAKCSDGGDDKRETLNDIGIWCSNSTVTCAGLTRRTSMANGKERENRTRDSQSQGCEFIGAL